MTEKVKIALIAGGVILLAVWYVMNNSPYNRCVEAITGSTDYTEAYAEYQCAKNL